MSNVVWEEFEKPEYGVIRGGLSGQYGDMPPEMHLKKLEQTCMYEREDQLDDFFRSTLKDRTPDQASLAQDLPRETQNQVRSEVMNIRHSAARTPAEPIHPDLFLGFTERDSRGYHNAGPDLKLYADQSRARGRFKDFVSDHGSDWTIPEGTRSELRHIRDLRKTINPTRERFKIFDTSFDSRANPWSGAKTHHASTIPKTTPDGQILNLNDAQEVNQRKDNTKLRTDLIKVGYRQTGDHRFAVAQYGLMRNSERKVNIHDNQYKNKPSHKFDIHPSEIKNRLFINMIKEVGRRKHFDVYRGDMAFIFKHSTQTKNNIKKLLADLSTAQMSTDQTADTIDLGYINNNIKKVRVYDHISHDMVVVDKDIFDKVSLAKNVTFAKRTDPLASRNVHAEEGKRKLHGDEVQSVVYKRGQMVHDGPLPTKMEHKWYDTEFAPIYKQNQNFSKGLDYSYTNQDQGVNPIADAVFHASKRGAGYLQGARDGIDDDAFNPDPVNDASNFTPSHRKMTGRSKIKN